MLHEEVVTPPHLADPGGGLAAVEHLAEPQLRLVEAQEPLGRVRVGEEPNPLRHGARPQVPLHGPHEPRAVPVPLGPRAQSADVRLAAEDVQAAAGVLSREHVVAPGRLAGGLQLLPGEGVPEPLPRVVETAQQALHLRVVRLPRVTQPQVLRGGHHQTRNRVAVHLSFKTSADLPP